MHHYKLRNQMNSAARGFSLLEVLIAVVVLSIGLLGLAGLQANGLRGNYSAYLRSQATFYANDIIDRMRANRNNALAGAYDLTVGGTPNTSGTAIADMDLTEWRSQVTNNLPSGASSTVMNGGIVTVVVQWDDSRASTDQVTYGTQKVTIQTEL